jgi:hypothetical protein
MYSNQETPLTLEKYERHFVWKLWEPILVFSGIGFVLAIILSALVYGMGKVVAWVVRGFRQTPTP